MNLNNFKKYLGLFVLAVAIIAVYKTFDNISYILGLFSSLGQLLTPFFISFAIAYLLYPLCLKTECYIGQSKKTFLKNNRRGLAVASVYMMLLVILSLIMSFIVPIAAKSISEFVTYLPVLIKNIVISVQSIDFYGLDFDLLVKNITPEKIFSSFELTNINKYAEGVMGISSMFLNIIMGIIISVYVLLDRHNLKNAVVRVLRLFMKPSAMSITRKYISIINTFVYKYIVCQLADALIIFLLTLIVLSIMRIPYAPVFAALLGLFNLIPYFGAIIAGVITVITTIFTVSPAKALAVAVVILVLQQIDGNIINPALVKDQLSVKPFWVILGILLGGGFFGVIGIFFAAPVMALLNIMIDDYLTAMESKKLSEAKSD